MKQQDVLKKIGGIISELSEQFQYLQSETEHLNSLELELFVANAHFLTDHAEILRKISNAVPAVKELPTVQETIFQDFKEIPAHISSEEPYGDLRAVPVNETIPALPEEVLTDVPEDTVASVTEPVEEKPVAETNTIANEVQPEPALPITPEPVHTPSAEPVPAVDLGGQTDTYNYVRQSPEPVTESTFSISSGRAEEAPAVPATDISDLGSNQAEEPVKPTANAPAQPETPLTLNQRLSAQTKGGQTPAAIAPAAASQPAISDLKSAISLNDKLLYVRDLFNGYNLAFSEALNLLNRCKNFDEADRLLKTSYAAKNNWAAHQATADKFYSLLHRRFGQ